MKSVVTGILCLLVAAAATAGVVVVADDGAALRIDAAKLAGMTDAAIRQTAPRAAAFTVTIAIEAPRVRVTSPSVSFRGVRETSESVRVTYTITDPSGAVRESAQMVLGLMHGGTLESRLAAMRKTADVIAGRVRAISGN